jgi:heat shock protein HtpX
MLNQFKTLVLLAGLTALFLWLGQIMGGQTGMAIAFVIAAAMNIGIYWFSDKIVLRMYKAREVTPFEAPALHDLVQELASRADLPMPKIYIIPEATPNAFATGRNPDHGSVAVTQGLLSILNREQLKGVIAHELGHIRNRDTLIMVVAATIAGALSHLANMAMWSTFMGGSSESENEDHPAGVGLLGLLVAPIAATLIQMAISRAREYLADEAGGRISENPLALADALRQLEQGKQFNPMQQGNPATAHLFIVNPLSGGGLVQLFSTHPPIEERIARLEAMALRSAPALA